MEPDRKHPGSLPSIQSEFERHQRERDDSYVPRYSMPPRHSVSTVGPVSPSTYSPSGSYPGYNGSKPTPPISRRSSGHEEPRDGSQSRSLPSLHEVFDPKSSFPAPSPIHTPPIGGGLYPGSVHHNPLPRSQPLEPSPHPSSIYPPPPPPPAPSSSSTASSEPFYAPNAGRNLPPNPYSSQSAIPPMHPPSQSYQPSLGHPSDRRSRSPPPPLRSSQYPSMTRPASPPRYTPAPPVFGGAQSIPPPPQHSSHQSQYPSYSHSQPSPSHPPPSSCSHPPPAHTSSAFSYPPPPPNEYRGPSHEPGYTPIPAPSKGIKRASGYANAIERALSISAIRRDLDAVKEHAAFIYHIIHTYQSETSQQIHSAALQSHVQQFQEAIQRSTTSTGALEHIVGVLNDLSAKEHAEKITPKIETHRSEYGSEEGSSFDREGGTHPPETKKQRRGRAAPPGRCHSCRRSETPEWRRGPDGARTLCNACGLHYAKLTRKLSKSAIGQASIPGRMPPSASPMS